MKSKKESIVDEIKTAQTRAIIEAKYRQGEISREKYQNLLKKYGFPR